MACILQPTFPGCRVPPPPRPELEGGVGGGGEARTQKFVYQKWPDQIFPFVNFIFSHDGHFGLGGGGGTTIAKNILIQACPPPPTTALNMQSLRRT